MEARKLSSHPADHLSGQTGADDGRAMVMEDQAG